MSKRKARVIFNKPFREGIYSNMWQFMSPNMIQEIFRLDRRNLKITYKNDIEDDKYDDKYKNSLCFKGDPERGGHYVYIDKNLVHHGTYEDGLLTRQDDDGVCHGVAIIYALGENKNNGLFPLIPYPQTREDKLTNYKSIIKVYIWLIKSGYWDKALKKKFYKDVTWIGPKEKTTEETQESLVLLKDYLNYLNSI